MLVAAGLAMIAVLGELMAQKVRRAQPRPLYLALSAHCALMRLRATAADPRASTRLCQVSGMGTYEQLGAIVDSLPLPF